MSSKLCLLSAVRAGTLGLLLVTAGCGGGSEHDDDGDDSWQPPGEDDAGSDAGTHADASPRSDGGNRDAKADASPDSSDGDHSDADVVSGEDGGDATDGSASPDDGGGDWTDASADAGPGASQDASSDASIDAATDAGKDASSDASIDAAADAGKDSSVDARADSATDARADSATDARVDAAADPIAACLQGAGDRGENTSDQCVQCGCTNCASQLSACYGATDVAAAGPAQGTSRGVLCAAVVECGRSSGCTGQECYCGTASTISCAFGGANGPCKAQLEAAAETTSATTMLQRESDTHYAIGRANAVSECSVDHCSTQCGL